MQQILGIDVREPFASELQFFEQNPNTPGMAAEDDRIVLNPFTANPEVNRRAVMLNEAIRIKIRRGDVPAPVFGLTDEQQRQFSTYGTPADIRATIAARLASGDPSAGAATPEQRQYVSDLVKSIGGLSQ